MAEDNKESDSRTARYGLSAAEKVLKSTHDILPVVFKFQDGLPGDLRQRFLEVAGCGRLESFDDPSKKDTYILLPDSFRPLQIARGGRLSCKSLGLNIYCHDARLPLHLAIAEGEQEIVWRMISFRPLDLTTYAMLPAVYFNRLDLLPELHKRTISKQGLSDIQGDQMLAIAAIQTSNVEVLVMLHEWGHRYKFRDYEALLRSHGCAKVLEFCLKNWDHTFEDKVVDLTIKFSLVEFVRAVPRFNRRRWPTYTSLAGAQRDLEVAKIIAELAPSLWKPRILEFAAKAANVEIVDYMCNQYGLSPTPNLIESVLREGKLSIVEWFVSHGYQIDECIIPTRNLQLIDMVEPSYLSNFLPLTQEVANKLVLEGVKFDERHVRCAVSSTFDPVEMTRVDIIDFLAHHCDPNVFGQDNLLATCSGLNDSLLLERVELYISRVVGQDDIIEQYKKIFNTAIEMDLFEIFKYLHNHRGLNWRPHDLDFALGQKREKLTHYMLDTTGDTEWIFERQDEEYFIMFRTTSPNLVERLLVENVYPKNWIIFKALTWIGLVDQLIRLKDQFGTLNDNVVQSSLVLAIDAVAVEVFKFVLSIAIPTWSPKTMKKRLCTFRKRVFRLWRPMSRTSSLRKFIEKVWVKYFPLDTLNACPVHDKYDLDDDDEE